jgi:FixJ family two-component response regulator
MLTSREREVTAHVVNGRLNKQIDNDIGISEMKVKIHRGQVARKMKAACVPELTRMADRRRDAGICASVRSPYALLELVASFSRT